MSKLTFSDFETQFLSIFSSDTQCKVIGSDTPKTLDLDSLDLVEVILEVEDTFNIPDLLNKLKKDVFQYVDVPLCDLCSESFAVYQAI